MIENKGDSRRVSAFIEMTLWYSLAMLTVVLLASAPIYAVSGHIDVAGALTGLFLVSLITLVLPRLRAFEAFGVKATLAEELRKAEVTIDQLKTLARSSARQGFIQLRSLPVREQVSMTNALNETLDAAGISPQEQDEFRAPMMNALAATLLSAAQLASVHLKVVAIRNIEQELRSSASTADREKLQIEHERLLSVKIPSFQETTNSDDLPRLLDSCLGSYPRSELDDRRLRSVIASARRIMSECMVAKAPTTDFLDMAAFVIVHTGGYFANGDADERAERLLNSRFGES